MTEQMKLELGGILRGSLSDLPAEKQVSELRYDWDQIGFPCLLPTLQQLAKQPLKDPGNNVSTVYTIRELKSIALERWYQLDPDGARREAIRQIGSAHPSMTAESLYFLEKESLPQFESIWAAAFMGATDYQQEMVFASLLAHYGSGSAVPTVRQKAEEKNGEWACAPQGAALGYLIEFDPASARPLVERAVQARGPGKTACNYSIFQDIAHYSQNPMLREIAIQTLDDPDPEVTMDALIYLMSYGDASDEVPISNRYTKWSHKWRGRSSELDSRLAGSPAGNWQEIGLGENLARALLANQGWLASEKLIQNTIEKCVGEQMCQQLKQLADRARTTPYSISAYTQADITEFDDVQNLFTSTKQQYGQIDIVVNNAGIMGLSPIAKGDMDVFRQNHPDEFARDFHGVRSGCAAHL
jgi:short chain dehydrogenase